MIIRDAPAFDIISANETAALSRLAEPELITHRYNGRTVDVIPSHQLGVGIVENLDVCIGGLAPLLEMEKTGLHPHRFSI